MVSMWWPYIFSLYTFGRWSNQQEYVSMSLCHCVGKFLLNAFEMIVGAAEFWGGPNSKDCGKNEMNIPPDRREIGFSRPNS